ncbi:MAG: glucose-6-phosphate isomerase [Clostridia bacterium]|nr:glucose-6-phosphate isomerase [Clostridia bacterium]
MIKLDLNLSDIPSSVFDKKFDNLEKILKDKYPLNTGWIDLPLTSADELDKIIASAEEIKNNYDYFVVIGIGGSYLGARCALNMLAPDSKVIFAGTSFDSFQINNVINTCKNKKIAINIISKSGTTLETLICYELLKKHCNLTNEAVYVTTTKGNKLDMFALENGFKTFYIPSDVGGRYSVLSPVGLLPMAVAGIDIKAIIKGALQEKNDILNDNSHCLNYALSRMYYNNEKHLPVEVLSSFQTSLHTFIDWNEQLYMESLGKDGKGLFSACGKYSTDLHSKGQYIQEGTRNFFETFLVSENSPTNFVLEGIEGFNYDMINGKNLNQINYYVEESTIKAHRSNNVSILKIIMNNIDAENLGAMFYFFEMSCAINGIMENVNPFDQNGVEEYKSNLKAMLKNN